MQSVLPRGEKTNVVSSGGAFVLAKKSCGSWRARNESPRQRGAHRAGRHVSNCYICLKSYWNVDPSWPAPPNVSIDSFLRRGAERRLFYVLAFLSRPRTHPRVDEHRRGRHAGRFDHPIDTSVHVGVGPKATVDHHAWNWGHAVQGDVNTVGECVTSD
jgi:hypothetical protein